MTGKRFRRHVCAAGVALLILVSLGACLGLKDTSGDRLLFGTFTGVAPILVGLIAALLGYSAQRRIAYLGQLRQVWQATNAAVNGALEYASGPGPDNGRYSAVMVQLRTAIDDVRCVYRNLPPTKRERDLYPYEPLKNVQQEFEKLRDAADWDTAAKSFVGKAFNLWKWARDEMVKEFDRDVPTFPHSHWYDVRLRGQYDERGLDRRPS